MGKFDVICSGLNDDILDRTFACSISWTGVSRVFKAKAAKGLAEDVLNDQNDEEDASATEVDPTKDAEAKSA